MAYSTKTIPIACVLALASCADADINRPSASWDRDSEGDDAGWTEGGGTTWSDSDAGEMGWTEGDDETSSDTDADTDTDTDGDAGEAVMEDPDHWPRELTASWVNPGQPPEVPPTVVLVDDTKYWVRGVPSGLGRCEPWKFDGSRDVGGVAPWSDAPAVGPSELRPGEHGLTAAWRNERPGDSRIVAVKDNVYWSRKFTDSAWGSGMLDAVLPWSSAPSIAVPGDGEKGPFEAGIDGALVYPFEGQRYHLAIGSEGSRAWWRTNPDQGGGVYERTGSLCDLLQHLGEGIGAYPPKDVCKGVQAAFSHSDGADDYLTVFAKPADETIVFQAKNLASWEYQSLENYQCRSSEVEVSVRTFIPCETAWAPVVWQGDRYFNGGSKTFQSMRVVPGQGDATTVARTMDETISYTDAQPGSHAWCTGEPTSEPVERRTQVVNDDTLSQRVSSHGDGWTTLQFEINANNPLALSPENNADIFVSVSDDGEYIVSGLHDGFPAYEIAVGGKVVYRHNPLETGNSPAALFPPMDQGVEFNGHL